MESIAQRAYQIWQESGAPHGYHNEHWFQAEDELLAASEAGALDKYSKLPRAQGAGQNAPFVLTDTVSHYENHAAKMDSMIQCTD